MRKSILNNFRTHRKIRINTNGNSGGERVVILFVFWNRRGTFNTFRFLFLARFWRNITPRGLMQPPGLWFSWNLRCPQYLPVEVTPEKVWIRVREQYGIWTLCNEISLFDQPYPKKRALTLSNTFATILNVSTPRRATLCEPHSLRRWKSFLYMFWNHYQNVFFRPCVGGDRRLEDGRNTSSSIEDWCPMLISVYRGTLQ